jgi:hypothetical protein
MLSLKPIKKILGKINTQRCSVTLNVEWFFVDGNLENPSTYMYSAGCIKKGMLSCVIDTKFIDLLFEK